MFSLSSEYTCSFVNLLLCLGLLMLLCCPGIHILRNSLSDCLQMMSVAKVGGYQSSCAHSFYLSSQDIFL